jgi:hypothetical protein
MRDSVYKKPVGPKHRADGAPGILIIVMDDIGIDLGSPVSRDYFNRRPFRVDGTIEKVEVQLR